MISPSKNVVSVGYSCERGVCVGRGVVCVWGGGVDKYYHIKKVQAIIGVLEEGGCHFEAEQA